jgi:hypothetical protein
LAVTAPTFANLTGGGTSSATSGVTASVSPTANRLIFVTVHAYLSTGSVQPATPSVTGNGITYALEKSQDVDTAGVDRATLFLFRGMSSSPTSGAVTISFGAVSQTRIQWSVDQSDANVNTSGTNGSGAVVQSTGVTLGSAGTSASVNYATTMRASSGGFSAWGHQVQEGKTPRSGWTEVADVTTVSLASVETQYIAGTDTAGSASWATSSRAGGIIVEVASPPVLLAAYSYSGTGTVADDSGNGRSFALTNSSARTSAGGGYTYGGAQPGTKGISQTTGEVQDGPAITGLNLPARTVETWAKGAGINDPGWFLEFYRGGADNTGVFGYLYLSSSFRGRAKNTSAAVSEITATPDASNWHHWALVADGKVLRLYKDGTQQGTDQTLTSIWDADNLRIFDGSGNGTFISETRIYDGALSTAQINTDLATPISSSGIDGSVAVTQANQTSSASGQLGYSGTSARTEANDTSSASGTVVNPVMGTTAAVQANQTSTATGQLGYSGTSARTQANQTSSASGQLGYSGTSARTQANQTSSASGQLGYTGTAAPTEAADASSASGTFTGTGISGNAAVTQAAQTASASGTFTAGSTAGSAAVTQANQTSAANGQLGYSGTSARAQANQTSATSGTVVNPVTGTASPVQANQTSSAVGQLGYSGTSARTQANNTSAAAGVVSGPVAGSAAVTQANQTASITGYFTALVTFGTASAGVMATAAASPASSATPTASGATGTAAGAQAATGAAPQANPGTFTVPTATGG